MQKKYFIITGVVILIIVAAAVGARFFSGENAWVCEDGKWLKHGNPTAPMPDGGCEGISGDPVGMKPHYSSDIQQKYATEEKIKVISLKSGDAIESPVEIEGEARGIWYFEGSFPIIIEDEKGNLLGQGNAYAQGEWMTEDFVPFRGVATYNLGDNEKGFVVLRKNNPSDLEEYDESIKIPVGFRAQEQIAIKIFFGKHGADSSMAQCEKVYPVERKILKTPAIGRAALEYLLQGPAENEKKEFFTSINPGVKVNSLEIEDGIAKVDFSKEIEEDAGGSCRVLSIRAQITETLKQFPTVKNVVISVDGRVDDALQP